MARRCFIATNVEQGFHIMRVNWDFRKKSQYILFGSRSAHNFLDLDLARKLGCELQAIEAQFVTIADGNQLKCQFICSTFQAVARDYFHIRHALITLSE